MFVIQHPDGRFLGVYLHTSHTPFWENEIKNAGRAAAGGVEEINMLRTLKIVQEYNEPNARMVEWPDTPRPAPALVVGPTAATVTPTDTPAPVANTVRLADDQFAALIAAIRAIRP